MPLSLGSVGQVSKATVVAAVVSPLLPGTVQDSRLELVVFCNDYSFISEV